MKDLPSLVSQMSALARARIQDRRGSDNLLTVLQLLRYGVCPCVAQGRYSTCCSTPQKGLDNA